MTGRANNGWTGGQYSAVRAAFGAALVVRCAALALGAGSRLELTALLACCVAGAFVAVGAWGRWAMIAAALLLFAHGLPLDEGAPRASYALGLALVFQATLPDDAPYGAWNARQRADPGGGWHVPAVSLLVLRLGFAATALQCWRSGAPPLLACAWPACLSLDPAWLRPRRASGVEHVFFDGECGLCHRGVRFAIAEDRSGARFRFAPLGGETWRRLVAEDERGRLPDSIVVRTGEGELLVRSRALRHVLAGLGGLWRGLAALLALAPSALLDRGYDAVARSRRRLFARTAGGCPVASPALRTRFDP